MEAIFMYTKNGTANEPHKDVLNLLKILDLKSSNKQAAFKTYLIFRQHINIRKI